MNCSHIARAPLSIYSCAVDLVQRDVEHFWLFAIARMSMGEENGTGNFAANFLLKEGGRKLFNRSEWLTAEASATRQADNR